MKKLSKFQNVLVIYVVILLLGSVTFTIYLISCLKQYEDNQFTTYINNAIKNKNILKDLNIELSEYETVKNLNQAYKELVNESVITYKEKEKNNYIISFDNVEILEMEMEEGESITKLGVLTFNQLSTKKLSLINNTGLYSYEVNIPSSYSLEINGKLVEKEKRISEENLSGYSGITSAYVPKSFVYKLQGFIKEPHIVVKNSFNEEVELDKNGKILSCCDSFTTDNHAIAMGLLVEDFDILSLAKDYSLFMTNDLGGSMRGFSKLEPYFIKGSSMYNLAKQWANGVDITFVSVHTFKSPMFSNEKLSNFKVYNEKAFSVLVHLDKNMVVKGKDRVDTMNNEWFFIYEDGWKLADMKHVNEGV